MTAPIDLRSDTVTQPSPAMRKAMAEAPVGDDVYGEDPSALRLESRVAELLGKEAALFVPSGSMGNQIAILLACSPGDDVVVGEYAHSILYESGAGGAFAGVQFAVAGSGGTFTADEMAAAVNPEAAYYMPRSRMMMAENTHNRGGGVVWPPGQLTAVAERARALGLATHLDGARLWNASLASGTSVADLAAGFDTVGVCFSKGLGAPVGSALAGSRDAIREARRKRKMLGGAMRQIGVLCAAALYALDHHRDGLADDHARARRLAEGLGEVATVDLDRVHTNLVYADVTDAAAVVARAEEKGVRVGALGPRLLRAVTHRDVGDEGIATAIEVLRAVISG